MSEVCYRWGSTNVGWKNANWRWNSCRTIVPPVPGRRICHRWGSCNILWKDANWLWSECQLVVEIVQFLNPGVDATTLIPPWQRQPQYPIEETIPPWEKNKEKKKKLIKLICKVKGETFDESKFVRDEIKIQAKDIKLLVKSMLNIEIDVKKLEEE